MNETERVQALISYLQVLSDLSKSNVKVFDEIMRTVKQIEGLIN